MRHEVKNLVPGTQEFIDKAKQLNQVEENLRKAKQAAKDAGKSLSDLAQEALELSPLGGIISSVNAAFLGTKSVLATVTTSFKTLRGAILATGLGALLLILGPIIAYFTSTEAGIEKVNRVLEPMKVLLQRVMDALFQVGEYLSGAFTDAINNPKKALQSFGDFILNNFMNRINAAGVALDGIRKLFTKDWKEGLKQLGDSMIQATTGITDGTDKMNKAFKSTGEFIGESVKQGQMLADLNEEIESAEIALTTSRAALNKKYQESLEIAKDQSKSEAERLAAAKAAAAAENDLLDSEQAFIDLKIKRMAEEKKFQTDAFISDEYKLQQAQLEAERTSFEIDASKRRTKAKSLENTIAKEIDGEAMARSDARRKKEEENDKRLAALRQEYLKASIEVENSLEDFKIKLMADGSAKKLAQLDLDTERELEKMDERRDKLLENETITEAEKEALKDQFAKMAEAKRQERKAAEDAIIAEEKQATLDKGIEGFEKDEEIKLLQLENSYMNAIGAETAKQEALLEIQRHYAVKKLELLQANEKGETAEALKLKNTILGIDKEIADGKIAEAQRAEDYKKAVQMEGLNATIGFLQLGLDLLEENNQARKTIASAMKAFEIGRVIVEGISEIQSYWSKTGAGIPIVGPAMATALSISAGIRTLSAVNKIRSTKYASGGSTSSGKVIDMMMGANGNYYMPNGQSTRNVGSFAKGGPVGSPSFGVIGEAGSEWVGPNWMIRSPKYANIFGYLEAERRRATPFVTGGMTAAAQIPQNSSATADLQQTLGMIEQFGEMNMKFDMMISLLEQWPTKLRVVNDPRDILDGVRVLNEIESDSRINR